jgi:hypothetical protein
MRGLMTTPSAGKYRDLLLAALPRICANKDLVSRQADASWMQHDQASQHFFDYVFRAINKLLHDAANVPRFTARPSNRIDHIW